MTATRDHAGRRGRFAGSHAALSRLVPSRFRSNATTQEPVYQITSARPGIRDDVDSRTRRYLFSMGVRTACFLGAVAASGWLRWVLIVGAVMLPYLSVVFANSGRERIEDSTTYHDQEVRSIKGPDG